MRDQAGHPVSFIDAVLELEIQGPGVILGESLLPLISGRMGVWIKTIPGETGTIRLSGKCRNLKSNIGIIEVN